MYFITFTYLNVIKYGVAEYMIKYQYNKTKFMKIWKNMYKNIKKI